MGTSPITDYGEWRMTNITLIRSFLSIDLGAAMLVASVVQVQSARFCFKTSQGILMHAFSSFGRRLNAVRYLVFRRIFAHTSHFFCLRRPPGPLPADPPGALRAYGAQQDAEPLFHALVYSLVKETYVVWFVESDHYSPS